MGIFASVDEVPVELESCHCDGTPHDHDTVWLRAEVTPDLGVAARSAIGDVVSQGIEKDDIMAVLGRVYLRHGIVRWTFTDAEGNPVPVTPNAAGSLKWEIAEPIADKADDLYSEDIFRPLVARLSKSSRNGRTGRSTSARTTTSRRRPKP